MAHIPYGYRIERGKAVMNQEQVCTLNAFLNAYLSGLSVQEAKKASGIELSKKALLNYMRSGTYAGTDYYPAIVEARVQERVLEELERRSHPGTASFIPASPVYTTFRMREGTEIEGTAAEKAAWLYGLIEAVMPATQLHGIQ